MVITGMLLGLTLGLARIMINDPITAEAGDTALVPKQSHLEIPNFKIINDKNEPVASASMILRKKGSRSYPTRKWTVTDQDGKCRPNMEALGGESQPGAYEYLVTAPGFPTVTGEVDLPTSQTEVPVTIPKGKEVTLQLTTADNQPIPDDLPLTLFPEHYGTTVWVAQQPDRKAAEGKDSSLSFWSTKAVGNGKFTLQVDETSTEPLYLLINHPGFLRGYQAGPFLPAEWITSGTAITALPRPAKASFSITGIDEKSTATRALLKVSRTLEVPGASRWSIGLIVENKPVSDAQLRIADLAPGAYDFETQLFIPILNQNAGVQEFRDRKSETLEEGGETTFTIDYKPFDPALLRGPYTANIKIHGIEGKPFKDKKYKLVWESRKFGEHLIAEGNIPADGKLEIKNLAGIDTKFTENELQKNYEQLPMFTFYVDNARIGSIYLFTMENRSIIPLSPGVTSKDFELNLPPSVGDTAPDFEMVDLVTSQTVRLKDFAGQVVLIDFWATWCGPCQGPMAENQDIMRKHKEDWKGKATILAISIDDDKETVLKHLAKNSWDQTRNTWAAPQANDPEKAGWQAPAAKLYGINSIPTMILIDKDGTIRQRGHISDIENSISNLLK